MCYGLTLKDTAALAYQYAVANNKLIPESHNNIGLQTPEATSLGRATSFNKTHVALFFKNLKEVIEKHNLTALQILQLRRDRCHKCAQASQPKHQKQVGKVTSAERDVLVTMKNFKAHMLTGTPTGSSGAAYSTGWMTGDNFLEFINYLIKIVHCSLENNILLILDNHESHYDIRVLSLSCFGPFKGYYNKAADEWMLNHPGTPISIYYIASVTGQTFPLAFTPTNIRKGFEKSGIYSYNSEVFQDSDFLSFYVSDRIEVANIETDTSAQNKGTNVIFDINAPSTSKSGCSKEIVSPEVNTKEAKRKLATEESSSEELNKICTDSSDGKVFEDNADCIEDSIILQRDFVLVKYSTKKTERFYVEKVLPQLVSEADLTIEKAEQIAPCQELDDEIPNGSTNRLSMMAIARYQIILIKNAERLDTLAKTNKTVTLETTNSHTTKDQNLEVEQITILQPQHTQPPRHNNSAPQHPNTFRSLQRKHSKDSYRRQNQN
ncbi:hypothetical protein ILUMI_10959 [Ignelater luminosus]|uniref:DDE-1 domain-containing protein n=1 Tax=Ignelater luminosus TaxID=2038154 RepID=A0A8K0D2B1_IGNLU|nr:hypothetical protein ILUMI_10959 [Ignelater luminosus]